MPKLLEKGKANGHVIFGIYVCGGKGNGGHGCGAKLEVYLDDLFQTSRTDYSGDTEYYATFECPDCGTCNDVNYNSTSSLPKRNELAIYNIKKQCQTKIQQICQNKIEKWQRVYDLLNNLDVDSTTTDN